MARSTLILTVLLFGAACAATTEHDVSEHATRGGDSPDELMPERHRTQTALGADRSGDVRPEFLAVLDALQAADGLMTVGDMHRLDLLPSLQTTAMSLAPPDTIRVWRRSIDGASASCDGRIDVIPFEDYVKGVLPFEWYASWKEESLRSGAVAIRSYAASLIASGGKYECADVDDTTRSQKYGDPDEAKAKIGADYLARTNAAVDDTRDIYLVKDESIVLAEYSAENGDPTEYGVDEPHCTGRARNGHGRGACQWGTQRWANEAGKTHDWILPHYYPGASLVSLSSEEEEEEEDSEPDVDDPEPDGVDEEPEEDTDINGGVLGGCTVASQQGAASLWLAVLAILAVRRRRTW